MIGAFHPRFTGGATADAVATLEPVSGTRALFLTTRSAAEGSIGRLEGISLEKARRPVDMTDIGLPPRQDDQGKYVFAAPTHRPQASPADMYPPRARPASTKPAPIAAATRMAAPPTLDGALDEWPADARSITLAESWDGSESAADPSDAWIAYDDEALYIAARHPMPEGAKLEYTSHTWGATDAMEIAIQDGYADEPGPVLSLYGWPDGHVVSTDEAGAPADVVARLEDATAYAAAVGDGEWTCEWRMPFAAMGFEPESAPMLSANFGVRKLAEGAWAIWRGTGGASHQVSKAGLVVFPDELQAADVPPTDGLEVWLDASDATTVAADETAHVSVWRDKSGNERHAEQPDIEVQPAYVTDGINGKPAVQFSEDTKTRLELPDISEEKITATIFAVFSNPEPGSEVNHDARIFTASDGEGYDYMVGLAATVPGLQTGGPRQSAQTFTDRWAKHVRVGCFSPGYQTYFTGYVAEILVYSRVMTREEQDQVRVYLAVKWELE